MDNTDTWSKGLRQLVKDWAERVVVLQNEDGSPASGIAWRKGYVVTADEAVGDHVKIVAAGGRGIAAELAGRDPSTDIALFKADVDPHPLEAAAAVEPGDFALAIGRGATSELVAAGVVAETGGEWRSSLGGKIDRKIRLLDAGPSRTWVHHHRRDRTIHRTCRIWSEADGDCHSRRDRCAHCRPAGGIGHNLARLYRRSVASFAR